MHLRNERIIVFRGGEAHLGEKDLGFISSGTELY